MSESTFTDRTRRAPPFTAVFMAFLYLRSRPHLENLRAKWHLTLHPGEPALASRIRSSRMLDIAMLALGLGFFVLSVGYAYACERL